jgi:hypothetical protein
VDANTASAEVSVSGGSDTEASKAEATKALDERGHLRTTSTVKKFTSFKPVSVNKTFLAAKGTTAVAPAKPGDKAITPVNQTASSSFVPRPRLVAKTGSGLRDSTPKNAALANGGVPGGAPDASAVWNKNRRTCLLSIGVINVWAALTILQQHHLQSQSALPMKS